MFTVGSETASPSELLTLSTSTPTRRIGLRREGCGSRLPIMFIASPESKILASYYPGRGQIMHPLAAFPTVPPTVSQAFNFNLENNYDSGSKGEEWFNDGHLVGLAKGLPSGISEAQAHEVC